MRAAQEAQNGIAETLVNLNTTREGLQEARANARLERDGLNEVTHDKPPHALIQLLMAFNNPFIYVLAILAGISFFTDYWLPTSHGEDGDLTTVIIIGTMVAPQRTGALLAGTPLGQIGRSAESDGSHHRDGRSSRTRRAKRNAT
ncbi:hypothetical protein LNO81_10905 [Klebsiella variicola subsp. variicola]|nr:hypothetical protein [Klebsiella variicola subsp. variicola]